MLAASSAVHAQLSRAVTEEEPFVADGIEYGYSIKNVSNHVVRCAMPSTAGNIHPDMREEDSRDVTLFGADVENRSANGKNVVDLAKMHDADETDCLR